MEPSLLEDLVAANRILAEHGVIDAYGHVSLRSPKDPKRFFLARAIAPETVQVEDILEYDLDGNPFDPRGMASVSERFIHSEVYRARPDVMSVVHNHSPSVIPFSVTGVKMRALFHMASFIGEGLPNFEIRKVKKGSDLLVRTPELGKALAASHILRSQVTRWAGMSAVLGGMLWIAGFCVYGALPPAPTGGVRPGWEIAAWIFPARSAGGAGVC